MDVGRAAGAAEDGVALEVEDAETPPYANPVTIPSCIRSSVSVCNSGTEIAKYKGVPDEPEVSHFPGQSPIQLRRVKPENRGSPRRNTQIEGRRIPPTGAEHVEPHEDEAHNHIQTGFEQKILKGGLLRPSEVHCRAFPVRIAAASAPSTYREHEVKGCVLVDVGPRCASGCGDAIGGRRAIKVLIGVAEEI